MKTIFVTLSTSAETKNLLRTDVMHTILSNLEVRCVLFVPERKLEFYRQEFGMDRILVEPVEDLEYGQSLARRAWRSLSYNSVPTRTVWLRSNKLFFIDKNISTALAFAWKKMTWVLGHTRCWREFVRFVEYYMFREDDKVWGAYFEKYKPDLAFATNIIHGTNIALVKQAKRRGVSVVGMIKSWDNLTSKGLLLCKPDQLIVPNVLVEHEAETLGDMLASRVFNGGCPQYDMYADTGKFMSREELCAELGIDPSKRILLYAMGGILQMDDPSEHIEVLEEAIEQGDLPPSMILVRAHPKYDVSSGKLMKFKHVKFYQPGRKTLGVTGEWEFDEHDVQVLMNTLRWSDIEMNTGSTLTIESAIFDRPVILIAFDGRMNKPYYGSIRQGLDVTHYRFVQSMNGCWRVNTPNELLDAVKGYLAHPEKHSEGRTRLVQELVGRVDGTAGACIGRLLLRQL